MPRSSKYKAIGDPAITREIGLFEVCAYLRRHQNCGYHINQGDLWSIAGFDQSFPVEKISLAEFNATISIPATRVKPGGFRKVRFLLEQNGNMLHIWADGKGREKVRNKKMMASQKVRSPALLAGTPNAQHTSCMPPLGRHHYALYIELLCLAIPNGTMDFFSSSSKLAAENWQLMPLT